MEITELAKDILVALIDKNPVYGKYNEDNWKAPAEKVGEAYRIILKSIKLGIDENNIR
jgi:hypothetical protein